MRPLRWKQVLALWVVMIALRQDFWFWSDATLVFGFMPVGLVYQAGYSILAAVVMWGLVHWQWPAELERLEGAAPSDPCPPSDRELPL